ncbi:hypothetical protein MMC22_007385, partial [Lobaria immixta]|nr:hypothetical protein [Lobaria immixta]
MAAPDEESMGEMASEIESVNNKKESKTDEAATENHLTVNDESSNSSEVVLETHSDTNQVASENISAANIVSISHQVSFLSLPAELRVLIFRHLLLSSCSLSTYWDGTDSECFPAILNTCRLIRREAYQVYFGENTFCDFFKLPRLSILNIRPIRDTVQNIQFVVWLNGPSSPQAKLSFIRMIHELGSPTDARGTLFMNFFVGNARNDVLSWYAKGLPRFTNFRTIRVEFFGGSTDTLAKHLCSLLCHNQELNFSPLFGPAEYFADGRGLQFRPRRYLNTLPPEVEVDWIDYLDGVRLNWSEGSPTN